MQPVRPMASLLHASPVAKPMPWTAKQQKLAHAVQSGYKPTGAAKGFSKAFADYVIEETPKVGTRKPVKKGKK